MISADEKADVKQQRNKRTGSYLAVRHFLWEVNCLKTCNYNVGTIRHAFFI